MRNAFLLVSATLIFTAKVQAQVESGMNSNGKVGEEDNRNHESVQSKPSCSIAGASSEDCSPIEWQFREKMRALEQTPIIIAEEQLLREAADRLHPGNSSEERQQRFHMLFVRYVCYLREAAASAEIDVSSTGWVKKLLAKTFGLEDLGMAKKIHQQLVYELDGATMTKLDEGLQGIVPERNVPTGPVGDFN